MDDILRQEERTIRALRLLYAKYGYKPYRMSKFEEYDLYANNRSFLPAGGAITFTDTNGRLMALKPDVTLSIAKNLTGTAEEPVRVYYDESVYRAPDRQLGFQEITQAGLEYLGGVDGYAAGEVVMLAVRSLEEIAPGSLLDVSHMGFINGLVGALGIDDGARGELLRAISGRSIPGIKSVCAKSGAEGMPVERLCRAVSLYGPVRGILPELGGMSVNSETERAVRELGELAGVLESFGALEGVNLDLSITSDMEYYNGLVFKGYVPGAPSAVLSGGRYDSLLVKLGKSGGAIGFAVYLNLLERLYGGGGEEYDADVLLLVPEGAAPKAVATAAKRLTDAGKSVRVQRGRGHTHCREVMELDAEGGLRRD